MKIHPKLLLALPAVVLLNCPPSVYACAACFGKSDSAMAKGMNAGIFALLAVIGTVLAGAASFFVFLACRASLSARQEQEHQTASVKNA